MIWNCWSYLLHNFKSSIRHEYKKSNKFKSISNRKIWKIKEKKKETFQDCMLTRTSYCTHIYNHRLIKTQIGHARDFTWYRGQRPSPARVILSHERVQIHARENLWVTRQIRHTFACVSCYCATFRLHFNHARRGRALAAISGKVPSVSGVCLQHKPTLTHT